MRERPTLENTKGLEILKDEVRGLWKRMNGNKIVGPDGITTEMLSALDEFGIGTIPELIIQQRPPHEIHLCNIK